MMDKTLIIGAGPAGMSAAITLAKHEEKVIIIDEYLQAGGRLLGQLYQEPQGNWWNGIEESQKLYDEAINLGVEIYLNESVVDIEKINKEWIVYTNQQDFQVPNVILATGAAEKPFSIPGWTLPGVMSVGAAQVMTNVQRVKPGNKGIIIGVNVLSSAIAMELQLAGIKVHSIALPAKSKTSAQAGNPLDVMNSLLHVSHMAPSKFIQLGSKFMKNSFMRKLGIQFYPKKGVTMWDIPVMLRKAVIKIHGKDVVEGVTIATITIDGEVVPGSSEYVEADFVCIAGGLYPLAELAALAGCPFYHIPELGGHIPLHNEKMQTTEEGLFVAGNITGIEGSKVAIRQGEVTGYAVLQQKYHDKFDTEITSAMQNVIKTRHDAYIQFHPDIEVGKEKMQRYWEERQLMNSKKVD